MTTPEIECSDGRTWDIKVLSTFLTKLSLKNDKVVLLVGSLISLYLPAGLPNGQSVSNNILSGLFPPDWLAKYFPRSFIDPIQRLLEKTAFEHIIEHHPRLDKLHGVFQDAFLVAQPNNFHNSLATLLQKGVVSHIITTNYDNGIEVVLAKHPSVATKPIHFIATEAERNSPNVRPGDPTVFKIHGCVKQPATIAFALRHEHFGDWKTHYLHELCKDATVIVIGYSGIDIDICPQIYAIRGELANLIWLYRKGSKLSPNAELLTDSTRYKSGRNILRVGWDAEEFMELFCAVNGVGFKTVTLPRDSGKSAAVPLVKAMFETLKSRHTPLTAVSYSPDDTQRQALAVWRANLANSLAFPNLAYASAHEYKETLIATNAFQNHPIHQASYLRMRGHAEYHLGQYVQSAESFRESIVIIDEACATTSDNGQLQDLYYQKLHLITELAAAVRDAEPKIPLTVSNWKELITIAISLCRTLWASRIWFDPSAEFYDMLNLFYVHVNNKEFIIPDDYALFRPIFGTLTFHIFLLHRDLLKDDEYIAEVEESRSFSYAAIVRDALNHSGNWRTAQYHEAHIMRNKSAGTTPAGTTIGIDDEPLEFPPVNDVVAAAMLAYGKADRFVKKNGNTLNHPAHAGTIAKMINEMEELIESLNLVAAFPGLWKLHYRILRLEILRDGYDIYDGSRASSGVRVSDANLVKAPDAYQTIIRYYAMIQKHPAVKQKEFASFSEHLWPLIANAESFWKDSTGAFRWWHVGQAGATFLIPPASP